MVFEYAGEYVLIELLPLVQKEDLPFILMKRT